MRASKIKRALDILACDGDPDSFFERVVEVLSIATGARWALVFLREASHDGDVIAKAFWNGKSLGSPTSLHGAYAPCSAFYDQDTSAKYLFIEQLQQKFESFPLAQAVCYEGASFSDHEGRVVGHIAVAHDSLMSPGDVDTFTFQLFAKHIGCEYRSTHLQKQFDMYQQMVRCAPHLMSLVDSNYTYRVVSKGYEEFFGKSYDEIVGASVADIHGSHKFNTFMKKHIDECLGGGSVSSRRWVEPKGRAPFFIDVHQAPCCDKDGNIIGVLTSAHDITQSKREEDQIARIAHLDHLTGLPNRRFLFQRLKEELELCKTREKLSALFFIDLDGFKIVNDDYGHAMGDTVLEIVAKRLRRSVRERDILARIGGDEFVLLISEAWEESVADAKAREWAEKLLTELSEPISAAGALLSIDASIGVHIINHNDGSSDDVIRKADVAMYSAKHDLTNRVCLG